jgi:hypothetical protein
MQRKRVIDHGADAAFSEELVELITASYADGVLVIDVDHVGPHIGGLDTQVSE